MKTLSLKLPEELVQTLAIFAKSRGQTRSEILREALRDYLSRASPPAEGSFLALAGDLVGCLEGPGDLSLHSEHLDGYGQSS